MMDDVTTVVVGFKTSRRVAVTIADRSPLGVGKPSCCVCVCVYVCGIQRSASIQVCEMANFEVTLQNLSFFDSIFGGDELEWVLVTTENNKRQSCQ